MRGAWSLVAVALALTVAGPAASASAGYGRTGEFGDWADHPPVWQAKGYVRPDRTGIIPINHYVNGWHYNPATVAGHGLWLYSRYIRTGDLALRRQSLFVARWLLHRQPRDGAWRNNFRNVFLRYCLQRPGWRDPLAQGLAMSLFYRAYAQTHDRPFKLAALRALRPFGRQFRRHNLMFPLRDGLFFDHASCHPAPLILNAHLLTVIGLFDISPWSPRARVLYESGRRVIDDLLPYYDVSDPITYDLTNRFTRHLNVSRHYQRIVVEALRTLSQIAPNRLFDTYAQRWSTIQGVPMNNAQPRFRAKPITFE